MPSAAGAEDAAAVLRQRDEGAAVALLHEPVEAVRYGEPSSRRRASRFSRRPRLVGLAVDLVRPAVALDDLQQAVDERVVGRVRKSLITRGRRATAARLRRSSSRALIEVPHVGAVRRDTPRTSALALQHVVAVLVGGEGAPLTSSTYSLIAAVATPATSAYFFTNFGVKAWKLADHVRDDEQLAVDSAPAPMPNTGMGSSRAMKPATSGGTASSSSSCDAGLVEGQGVLDDELGGLERCGPAPCARRAGPSSAA